MVLKGFFRSRIALTAVVGLSSLLIAGMSPAQAQTYTTISVMEGLFNPRGLTVASDGSIYVAESGRGGNGTEIGSAEGPVRYGNTSGVSVLRGGVQTRLLSNLPSLAGTGGGGATGLSDIIQGSDGFFYGVTGFVGDPALRSSFTGAGEQGNGFGRLVRFDFSATPSFTYIADLSANEAVIPGVQTGNPDGADVNSNPFSLVQTPTGFVVSDAGANLLLDVSSTGVVSTKTILPLQPTPAGLPGPPDYQPVPTGIAYGIGSQGSPSLFVSQLTGYPFPKGGAKIYEVNPATGAYRTLASGFTNLIDVTYANGFLYALELTTNGLDGNPAGAGNPPGPGNLWRVDVATGNSTRLLDNLFFPGGVAVGRNNEIYVTTGTVVPGGGSVLQVVAAPEPGTIALMLLGGAAVPLVRRRKRSAA